MAAPSDIEQPNALAEGRRIYLGNILYDVQPAEIEETLTANGRAEFEHIHISIDPIDGRTPGYCFVDFKTRDAAERVLNGFRASIRGRTLKVGPCEPKKGRHGAYSRSEAASRRPPHQVMFDRWGDWNSGTQPKGNRGPNTGVREDVRDLKSGPHDAVAYHDRMTSTGAAKDCRLFVGNLARMIDQVHHDAEIREIFEGFSPVAIGKRSIPYASRWSKSHEYDHYCYVDFATAGEVAAAAKAIDGTKGLDGRRPLQVHVVGENGKAPHRTRASRASATQGDESTDGIVPKPYSDDLRSWR